MIESIKFSSVLSFDENVKEEFISEIWGGAIDRWRGVLTTESREAYLQRIDHEIFYLLLLRSFKSKKTCFIRTRDDYPAENAIESS